MQTQIQLKPYGYIYKLTCIITNKRYYGQTIRFPDYRFTEYKGLHCKKQYKLYYALRKYGPENFTYEIIATAPDKNTLDFLEDAHIVFNNTIMNGYNIRRGGSNGKMSDESKLKMSISHKGMQASDSTKLKMSLTRKGKLPYIISEQTRQNMSIGHTGQCRPHTHQTKLKISATRKGMKFSPDHIMNMSLSRLGKKRSEETKHKISETLRLRSLAPKQ
jgi:group I intron endonuclease